MPRYFFDVHDSRSLARDPEGQECGGHEEIRLEAMHVLPEVARDAIPTDGDQQTFTALVRNEKGVTVYTATLTFAGLWVGDEPMPEPEPIPA